MHYHERCNGCPYAQDRKVLRTSSLWIYNLHNVTLPLEYRIHCCKDSRCWWSESRCSQVTSVLKKCQNLTSQAYVRYSRGALKIALKSHNRSLAERTKSLSYCPHRKCRAKIVRACNGICPAWSEWRMSDILWLMSITECLRICAWTSIWVFKAFRDCWNSCRTRHAYDAFAAYSPILAI